MLTARGDDADQVLGLEIGDDDDYLAKPVRPRVLLGEIDLSTSSPRGRARR
jgi:two-component system response regulator RstA